MIDEIGTLRRLTTAIAAISTDAMRGTDDATLQATWTDAMATALANYTAARAGYLDELAAANLPTDISTIDTVVDGIQTDLSNGTDGLGALKTLIDAIQTDLDNATDGLGALKDLIDALQTTADAITAAGPTKAEMDTAHALLATEAKQDIIDTNVDQIEVLVDSKVMGRAQIAVDDVDLDSLGVASYVIFTGTTQDIVIESVVFRTVRDLSGDAGFTGISIETDDTTEQVFVAQADGVKANLTAQSQLAWTGAVLLKATSTISLQVYGGAVAGSTSLCYVWVTYRAVVSGGYLNPE